MAAHQYEMPTAAYPTATFTEEVKIMLPITVEGVMDLARRVILSTTYQQLMYPEVAEFFNKVGVHLPPTDDDTEQLARAVASNFVRTMSADGVTDWVKFNPNARHHETMGHTLTRNLLILATKEIDQRSEAGYRAH